MLKHFFNCVGNYSESKWRKFFLIVFLLNYFARFSWSAPATPWEGYYLSNCVEDTQWNTKNVSESIKSWMDSIRVIPNVCNPGQPNVVTFHDDEKTRLEVIGIQDARSLPVGPIWASSGFNEHSNFINGFFYGRLDQDGELTGKRIAYIFPDMKTALVGTFKNSLMIRAKESRVVAERCVQGIKRIKLKKPKRDSPIYRYQESTLLRIGHGPTLTDPYERKTVYVKDAANMDMDMGEGLFAKRDIRKHEQVSYYNGIVINVTTDTVYHVNQSIDEIFKAQTYMIMIEPDLVMDIPSDMWTLDKYRATLTHKCNHSFNKTNVEFNKVYHPRFGIIRGIFATKDIRRGEEVLVDYGYGVGYMNPPWYNKLQKEHLGPDAPPDNTEKFKEKLKQLQLLHANKKQS